MNGPPSPLVDVAMPTRGSAPFLSAAVDSIFAQTFGDWRLTIAENGVGDPQLAEALQPYLRDGRVRHVVHGTDLGLAGNHTAVVRAATAPLVAILHDDDGWDPEFLSRRVAFLDEHPECALVFGRYRTIDETGAVLATPEVPLSPGVHQPESFVPPMLRTNVVGMPTVVVRRSAYEAVGMMFRPDFPMVDREMWLRIGSRFPVGHLDVVDASWRFHSRQRSARVGRWGEIWLAYYDAVDELLAGVDVIPVDERLLRDQRVEAHLCAALDAVEAQEPDRAREHLAEAQRLRARAAYDARALTARAALRLGGPGAAATSQLRGAIKRARGRAGPLLAPVRRRARVLAAARPRRRA